MTVDLHNSIIDSESRQEARDLGPASIPASDSSPALHPAWVLELIMAHSAETWERAAIADQISSEFHVASF